MSDVRRRALGERPARHPAEPPTLSVQGGGAVFCYDGSPGARRALEQAADLCMARTGWAICVWQSPIVLFGDTHSGVWDLEDRERVEQLARERAEDTAREGAGILSTVGISAEPSTPVATGSVWRAVLDFADQHDAGLVVVGSRGRSAVTSLVLGSVSHGLANHSHRPLLIVPAAAR
jgi:nucleotide-binding universal stress UspA family protein